jgi:hypothetical protein
MFIAVLLGVVGVGFVITLENMLNIMFCSLKILKKVQNSLNLINQ